MQRDLIHSIRVQHQQPREKKCAECIVVIRREAKDASLDVVVVVGYLIFRVGSVD